MGDWGHREKQQRDDADDGSHGVAFVLGCQGVSLGLRSESTDFNCWLLLFLSFQLVIYVYSIFAAFNSLSDKKLGNLGR